MELLLQFIVQKNQEYNEKEREKEEGELSDSADDEEETPQTDQNQTTDDFFQGDFWNDLMNNEKK